MELFDENIEQVILQKEYFELTPAEREVIDDFVSNEEEYLQFKTTLLMSTDIKTENIKPKAETKESLMALMEESRPERKIWYNAPLVFLFPEDKPSFAKPGVYLAFAAILITVFLIVPLDFGSPEMKKDMAKKEADSAENKTSTADSEDDVATSMKEELADEAPMAEEESIEKTEEAPIEMEADEMVMDNLNEEMTYADGSTEAGEPKETATLSKTKKADKDSDVTIDHVSTGFASNGAAVSEDVVGGNQPASPGADRNMEGAKDSRYKMKEKGYISTDLKKDGFKASILNDNALNQTSNLIDLLYTAD